MGATRGTTFPGTTSGGTRSRAGRVAIAKSREDGYVMPGDPQPDDVSVPDDASELTEA